MVCWQLLFSDISLQLGLLFITHRGKYGTRTVFFFLGILVSVVTGCSRTRIYCRCFYMEEGGGTHLWYAVQFSDGKIKIITDITD